MRWPQTEAEEAGKRLEEYLAEKEGKGQLLALVERGIINRKTLAHELNIVYSKLVANAYLKSILSKWNSKLRAIGIRGSKWDLLPNQVREHLETAHQTNTLPVFWEKHRCIICRTTLATYFNFPNIQFTRNAELRAVVQEFDAKIDPTLYPRKSKHDDLEKSLRQLVSAEDVVLHRGEIDKTALAAKLCVSPAVFKFVTKFEQIIVEANKTIRLNRHGRELDPFVVDHNRRYDFHRHVEAFGLPFTLKLAQAFAGIATRFAIGTSKGHYNILNKFLSFVAVKYPLFCNEAKRGTIQRDTLERIIWIWRDDFLANNSSIKPTTTSCRIKTLNSILKELADAQILPEVFPLSPVSNARRETTNKPTFGQMCAGTKIHDILAKQGLSQGDRDDWLLSLEQEREKSPDLPEDTLEALKTLNSRRRERLNFVAAKQMVLCHQHFLKGEKLISSSDLTGAEIDERVKSLSHIPRERGAGLAALFPRDNLDVATARYLNFQLYRWGACLPAAGVEDDLGQFWSKTSTRLGGIELLSGYLCATTSALVAAQTLFLEKSGANVSVGLELSANPFEASDVAGYSRVVGFKARAKGAPVYFDLPEQSTANEVTAVQALRMIQQMTARLRVSANGDGKFFLLAGAGEASE